MKVIVEKYQVQADDQPEWYVMLNRKVARLVFVPEVFGTGWTSRNGRHRFGPFGSQTGAMKLLEGIEGIDLEVRTGGRK